MKGLVVAGFAVAGIVLPNAARADDAALHATPPPEPPLAGFHDGLFFLRDKADIFRLYVEGRVHIDAIGWFGPGIGSLGPGSALKTTLSLRRARAEIAGEFFEQWQWQLSADFGQPSPVEPATQRTLPTDAFINFAPSPWLNVQVGQYLIPFTMENPVSDNTTPFLERSIVSRGLGTPFTRDIGAMIWGEAPNRLVYYTVGLYNGDGPNRTNADSRFDVVARTFARPFYTTDGSPLKNAQVGVSFRYGSRDARQVGYDQPSLTTQGGYAFWKAMYKDSLNRTMHIIPSAEQTAIGADVYVPVDGFDFTGEIVYADTSTREAADGFQLTPFTERTGTLKGYAYYLQVGYWIFGSRDIIGTPSYGRPKHLDFSKPMKPPRRGLQALVKLERLHLSYAGAARGGLLDPSTPNGDVDMTSVSVGMNYWATRHLRVGINYVGYALPNSATIGRSLHEAQARVGVQF